MVEDLPETAHQTRDNTDFPRPPRKSEARLRLACPPLARRNRAPHGRGAGGESDPPIFGADAPPEGNRWSTPRPTYSPPVRGGRSHQRDPCGKAIKADGGAGVDGYLRTTIGMVKCSQG